MFHTPAHKRTTIMNMTQYIDALKSHDWDFRFSDAMRTYERGMDQHKALKAAAKELDPDMAIWNTYAPVGHKTP
jgi:hypothetical protein